MAHIFGLIATGIGFVLTISGLALTARALWITHDNPTWPEISPRGARIVRKIGNVLRKRPPVVTGTIHAATAELKLGPVEVSAFGTTRRPIADDDNIETKVNKLINNLGQLQEAVNHQTKKQQDRMANIENSISTHHKKAAALESQMSLDRHEERARKSRALPAEAFGLALAAFGQFLALAGAFMLAF